MGIMDMSGFLPIDTEEGLKKSGAVFTETGPCPKSYLLRVDGKVGVYGYAGGVSYSLRNVLGEIPRWMEELFENQEKP